MDDADLARRDVQKWVVSTPTYLVDGHLGFASAFGIARITFGTYKVNLTPGADQPLLSPAVTFAVSEHVLLAFAQEVIERAKERGISLEQEQSG